MQKKEKVILRRISEYDPAAIARIIGEGLAEFGLNSRLKGRITIKPNIVIANKKVAPSAYTRPEFIGGLLETLSQGASKEGSDIKITIAEKTGAALPTARMFKRAGYHKLRKKHSLKLVPIEEAKKMTVPLKKGKIHQKIRTAREIADRDFLIYAPKLKTNALAHGLTGALKLNIGILCDRERMWNHNYNLDEKIVDLLEVGHPDFIATDAIEVSFGGNHMSQHGHHLGIILMATNPLAHDVVGAHIFHLDPRRIGHLRAAHERGCGPISLDEIALAGDISLAEVMEKTRDWDTRQIRVDEVDCNIKVLSGEPYCTGGCHGVLLDWLYMIKDRKPKLWANLPDWTFVVGKYKGDITARRLMILGTCSEIEGQVKARRKGRINGCPPKHKTLVLLLFLKAGMINPFFRLDLIIDAYPFLFLSWARRFLRGRF